MPDAVLVQELAALVRNVPDFPKPGIQFKDITTLLLEPSAFRSIIDAWAERYAGQSLDLIVGIDARGFIFGAALAYAMGVPFAPARKRGKLPAETIEASFELEYGSNWVQLHRDAVKPGQRVLIVDDLLATGGTSAAVCSLVEQLGGKVIEACFAIELPALAGREKLAPAPVHALLSFDLD